MGGRAQTGTSQWRTHSVSSTSAASDVSVFAESRAERTPRQAGAAYAEDMETRDDRPRREPLWRDLIGDVLRRERQAQDRTLQDVADAARISMPYLSELERGRKEASSEILAATARALGLRLSDLVDLAHSRLGEYETSAVGTQPAAAHSSAAALGGRGALALAA